MEEIKHFQLLQPTCRCQALTFETQTAIFIDEECHTVREWMWHVNLSDTLQRKQYLFRSSSVSDFHCGFIRSWMFKCAVKKLWKQFGSGLWTNRIRVNEERRSNYRGKTKKYNNIRCTALPAAGCSPSVSSTSQFVHIRAVYVLAPQCTNWMHHGQFALTHTSVQILHLRIGNYVTEISESVL